MFPVKSGKTPAALLCLLLAGASQTVRAQEYRHHELPAVRDYVISLEAPTRDEITFFHTTRGKLIGGKGGEYQAASTQWKLGEAGNISLTVEVYDEEIAIEDWLESQQAMLDFTEQTSPDSTLLLKIHESGYSSLMGQRTFYRYVSPRNVFVDSDTESRNFRNPMGKQVMAVFDGRVRVMLTFMDDQGVLNNARNMNAELEPSLDRTAKSLEVKFEELFESFRETEHFVTDMKKLSSDPLVMGSLSVDVPVDWIASDQDGVDSDPNEPPGRGGIRIEINHFDPAMFSAAAPRMWLAIEGLEAERLNRRAYEQHGQAFLEARLASARELDSRDATDELSNTEPRYAHCMSRHGVNHTEASGGMTATSYRGKDEKGRDVMALHYSGGGSYVACNYLLMVTPEQFPETKAQFETMLKTLTVTLLGPWNQSSP